MGVNAPAFAVYNLGCRTLFAMTLAGQGGANDAGWPRRLIWLLKHYYAPTPLSKG